MTKKQDCKIKHCGYYRDGECFVKGVFSNGAICPNYSNKQEPQPATCPDCGHPVSEHGEYGCRETHKADDTIYEYCECEKTPADLQPEKQCTHPDQKSTCYSAGCGECEYQPTRQQMPLREQFAEILYGDKEVATAYEVYPLFTKTLNQLMKKVEAHDSAIAAQARREFTDEFDWIAEHLKSMRVSISCARLEIAYIDDNGLPKDYTYTAEDSESVPVMLHKALAHIRAMAEGKE